MIPIYSTTVLHDIIMVAFLLSMHVQLFGQNHNHIITVKSIELAIAVRCGCMVYLWLSCMFNSDREVH